MARWKLMTAHYINSPGTEWEYSETSRSSGKAIRRRFEVPIHLDPTDPSHWTQRQGSKNQFNDGEDGAIIVCTPGTGDDTDIIFLGDPTPDMLPVDDEAKSISDSFKGLWAYKPETEAGNFSQALVDRFQTEMDSIKQSVKPTTMEIPGLMELAAALAVSVKQNSELIAALTKGG